jgi:general secretion pathway protein G
VNEKKAFSIIEIIFVITIISILLVVAIPKIGTMFEKANLTHIKSTVILIQEGIQTKKNQHTLSNTLDLFNSLDEGGENLFTNVLATPIQASQTTTSNSWKRLSSNSYQVYLNSESNVIFTYDPDTYTFSCDYDEPLCKELSQ